MKLGQKVKRIPSWCGKERDGREVEPVTGYVSYIHPKRRFYTVTFPFKSGSVRECYLFVGEG